ncbi:MAG: hypothetical protein GY771_04405, partial [bacterium]|nr:hypothetical protein [bacterium]
RIGIFEDLLNVWSEDQNEMLARFKIVGPMPGGGMYMGLDPTGNSLHVGHLLPMLLMRAYGHQTGRPCYVLFGDLTAMIGDPTGRAVERPPLTYRQVTVNMLGIMRQVKRIFPEFNIVANSS